MNRPTRPSQITGYAIGQDTLEVIRAIGSLSVLFDNTDTIIEEAAVGAAAMGRPAFWTTGTYHNQAAARFARLANQETVEAALLDAATAMRSPACIASSPEFLLCSLIPLNIAARNALEIVRGQRPAPASSPARPDVQAARSPRDFLEVPHCSATVREGA